MRFIVMPVAPEAHGCGSSKLLGLFQQFLKVEKAQLEAAWMGWLLKMVSRVLKYVLADENISDHVFPFWVYIYIIRCMYIYLQSHSSQIVHR